MKTLPSYSKSNPGYNKPVTISGIGALQTWDPRGSFPKCHILTKQHPLIHMRHASNLLTLYDTSCDCYYLFANTR